MTLYLILMYLVSLALGYVLAFTQATLFIGRELSDAGTPTGYQDAITPPRFTTFAILVYALCLVGVSYGIWTFGWLTGLGVTFGLLLATSVNLALILPKKDSQHFRGLVVHSLINRNADYLRFGDTLRASVIAELLDKLGIPVNKLVAQLKKEREPTSLNSTAPHIVVADFGEVLAVRAPVPGSVADVDELPYPKDQIKLAILITLKVTNDPELREHLKFAYVSLADWQDGVGATHKGLDATKLDRSKPIQDLLNEIGDRGEEMKKWQPIVKAEQEALVAELRKLGFW